MSATTATLMILGIVGFSLLAIGGVIAWQLIPPSAKWQTFDSVRGGFKVEFPAPSQSNVGNRFGVSTRSGTTTEGTSHRGIEYTVAWSNIPRGSQRVGHRGSRNLHHCDGRNTHCRSVQRIRHARTVQGERIPSPRHGDYFGGRWRLCRECRGRGFTAFRPGCGWTSRNCNTPMSGDSSTRSLSPMLACSTAKSEERLATAERDRIATEQARAVEAERIEAERRRFEEQRLAEERVRELTEKKRLHSQMIAEQNESFLKTPRDGSTSPTGRLRPQPR